MRCIEIEHIGVHRKDQHFACDLDLRLELTAVAIVDSHTSVELTFELVVEFGIHLVQALFEQVERREGVVIHPLFQI